MEEAIKIMHEVNINRPLVARLRAHMLRKGLNPKTLAERANVGRSFVYDILNGKSTNPTSSKLAAIAEQLGVSVNYLVSGVQQVMSPRQREWSDVVEISSIEIEESVSGNMLVSHDHDTKPYYFRSDWVNKKLHARPEDLRTVFVNGDGMGATMQQGDMLLINITRKVPNPPGLFVIFDGMGPVVKRLEMVSTGCVRVISDNSQYSPYERELSELNIVGKVVWLAREL